MKHETVINAVVRICGFVLLIISYVNSPSWMRCLLAGLFLIWVGDGFEN